MDSHYNIPRDVRSIIYKYIHRDNYIRCIDEYNRIYVPHWKWNSKNGYKHFSYCDDNDYNYYERCPIINNDHACPMAMHRTIHKYPIYKIIMINDDCTSVAKLPPNYI